MTREQRGRAQFLGLPLRKSPDSLSNACLPTLPGAPASPTPTPSVSHFHVSHWILRQPSGRQVRVITSSLGR